MVQRSHSASAKVRNHSLPSRCAGGQAQSARGTGGSFVGPRTHRLRLPDRGTLSPFTTTAACYHLKVNWHLCNQCVLIRLLYFISSLFSSKFKCLMEGCSAVYHSTKPDQGQYKQLSIPPLHTQQYKGDLFMLLPAYGPDKSYLLS